VTHSELEQVMGVQTPRFQFEPESKWDRSAEVIDLMEQIGMPMDEWQQIALRLMLGERADGQWSAFEFGLIVARQNGKGGVLEARELGGLFLFGEKHIIHSAHEEPTAAEAYLRMYNIIDGTPWLSKRIKKMIGSPGKQLIELKTGQRLVYRTRTPAGGRGFGGSPVIFDEAQSLTPRQIAALMPVVNAQPTPQIIYTGTVLPSAMVFRGVVERGRKQIGSRLGYAEWSAANDADQSDPHVWAQANPAQGGRIQQEVIAIARESLTAAGAQLEFGMEYLSIWPDATALGTLIPIAPWEANLRSDGTLPQAWSEVSLGLGVSPGRDFASIGAAVSGPQFDYVELIQDEPETDWVLPYLVDLFTRRPFKEVLIDQAGPAATFIAPLVAASIPVRVTDTAAYKKACATFVDAVKQGKVTHRGQPELTAAAYGVKEHRVGDSFVYARRDSGVRISSLEAVTLARWGLTPEPKKEFFMMNLNDFV